MPRMNGIWNANPCRLFWQTLRFVIKKNLLVLIVLLIVEEYSVESNNVLFNKTDISKTLSFLERICKKYDKHCKPGQITKSAVDLSNSKNVQVQPQATAKFSMNWILTRNKRSSIKDTNSVTLGQADDLERMEMSSHKITQFCELTFEPQLANIGYECEIFSAELHNELLANIIKSRNTSSNQDLLPQNSNHEDRYTLLYDNTAVIKNAAHHWKIPINTTTLLLRNLKITEIDDKAFNSLKDSLRDLSLDNNAISYISRRAFAGLDGLLDLDLSHNRIRSLPACVFSSLIRLRKLNLMHNEIEYIGWKTFSGLRSLIHLDLSSNALEGIHTFGLRHFRSTQSVVIDLSKNKLTVPTQDWLLLGRPANNFCDKDSGESILKREYLKTNENLPKSKIESNETHHLSTKRIIWAEKNLWSCRCSGSSNILEFATTMLLSQSFVANNGMLLEPIENSLDQTEHTFQYDSIFQVNWEVALPCVGSGNLTGLNFDTSPKSLKLVFEYCCVGTLRNSDKTSCQFINQWLEDNTEIAPKASFGLTNNQVTVVGIIIVVLSPILLTLCPDCNKQMSSSSKKPKDNQKDKKEDDEQISNSRVNIVVTKHFPETGNQAKKC